MLVETPQPPVQRWPRLTVWYLLGLLIPVSFGVKLIWGLSGSFVEPAFLLTALLWWRRRRIARLASLEWLLVMAFCLSAVLAYRHPQLTPERWLTAWSHTFRMLALLLLVAVVRTLNDKQLASLCRGVVHSLFLVLGMSVLVAAIGMSIIPNVLGIDLSYVDFTDRFVIHLGHFRIPRFFGLFDEPAPFGAFGVASLILFMVCRSHIHDRLRRIGIVLSCLVVILSMSDQALIALLVIAAFRKWEVKRHNWIQRIALPAVVFVAMGPYLAARLASKATEFSAYSSDVWGTSGAERVLNSVLALSLTTQSWWNFLFGIGPSLFGIFLAEWFPVLSDRQQVQFLLPDLLCSVGIVGLAIAILLGLDWLAQAKRLGNRYCLFALLAGVMFQSDFKSPALAVAIGVCLAGTADSQAEPRPRRFRLLPWRCKHFFRPRGQPDSLTSSQGEPRG